MKFVSMQVASLPEPKVAFDEDYQHLVRLIAYVLKMDEVGNVKVFGLDDEGLITQQDYDDGGFVVLQESIHSSSILFERMYDAIVNNNGLCKAEDFLHYVNSFGIRVINDKK